MPDFIKVNTPDGQIEVAAQELADGRIEQSVHIDDDPPVKVNLTNYDISGLPVTVTNSGSSVEVEITAVIDGTQQAISTDFPLPVLVSNRVNTNMQVDGQDVSMDTPMPVHDTALDDTLSVRQVSAAPNTSTLTTVDVSDDPQVTLLSDNSTRRISFSVHNHSSDSLFISLGNTCSESEGMWSQVLQAHSFAEFIYSGIVTAVRPAGSASAPVMLTEILTPEEIL